MSADDLRRQRDEALDMLGQVYDQLDETFEILARVAKERDAYRLAYFAQRKTPLQPKPQRG